MAYGPTGGLCLQGWTSPAPHWNGMEWDVKPYYTSACTAGEMLFGLPIFVTMFVCNFVICNRVCQQHYGKMVTTDFIKLWNRWGNGCWIIPLNSPGGSTLQYGMGIFALPGAVCCYYGYYVVRETLDCQSPWDRVSLTSFMTMATRSTCFGWWQLVGRRISLRQIVMMLCLTGSMLLSSVVLRMMNR